MDKIGARRLLKLAGFLDTLPRAKFNYRVVTRLGGTSADRGPAQAGSTSAFTFMMTALRAGEKVCGTTGCAIGWMPAVWPKHLEWAPNGGRLVVRFRENKGTNEEDGWNTLSFLVAARFFRITPAEATDLFDPGYNNLPGTATPKQVARHIRRFVRANQKLAEV